MRLNVNGIKLDKFTLLLFIFKDKVIQDWFSENWIKDPMTQA